MTHSDDTDNRLRKLLRGLPRVEAPGDFEARVAGQVAREGPSGRSRLLQIRPFAIPGLALLFVGALSYLVYMTQFRYDGGDLLPPADERSMPTAPAGAPPGTSTPESRDRSHKPDRTNADAAGKKLEPPALARPQPSAVTLPTPKEKALEKSVFRGKSVPGRTLMLDLAVPDTTTGADSLALSDTLVVDSARGDANSLRDSVRNPKPE